MKRSGGEAGWQDGGGVEHRREQGGAKGAGVIGGLAAVRGVNSGTATAIPSARLTAPSGRRRSVAAAWSGASMLRMIPCTAQPRRRQVSSTSTITGDPAPNRMISMIRSGLALSGTIYRRGQTVG